MRRSIVVVLFATLLSRCLLAGDADTLVGAYYYAWYNGPKFNCPTTAGDNTLIYHLEPKVMPRLGWYNQRKDPAVLSQHFKWAKYAGIDFFVCSYWGKESATDKTIRGRMLDNPDRGDIKLCVFWEPSLTKEDNVTSETIMAETEYLFDNYFDRPAYLRVDGKPVIVIYVTRAMDEGQFERCIKAIRKVASARDKEVYIVGDEVWGKPRAAAKTTRVKMLDAVTNYDSYGNLGSQRFVTDQMLDKWQSNNALWKAFAEGLGKDFIPAITPGYNDRGVRGDADHIACSRKLNHEQNGFGSLFRGMIDRLSDDTEMVIITSWNEWHEDTQIEPTTTTEPTTGDDRNGFYTQGVQYHGYGMLYLDILRRTFGSAADSPLAAVGMDIKYCAREAQLIDRGMPLATILRSLDRAAGKKNEKGQEAAKFAESLRNWVGEKSKELLKESRNTPARTLARLKKHIRIVSGLDGTEVLKAREKEVRQYKGTSQLLTHYTRYDTINRYIADNGKSQITDQAMASLKKRLERFLLTKGLHESIAAEAKALLGML